METMKASIFTCFHIVKPCDLRFLRPLVIGGDDVSDDPSVEVIYQSSVYQLPADMCTWTRSS